ncbi:MAG: hypothetical protein ABFS35_05590 [Bacteroidota bacterium]
MENRNFLIRAILILLLLILKLRIDTGVFPDLSIPFVDLFLLLIDIIINPDFLYAYLIILFLFYLGYNMVKLKKNFANTTIKYLYETERIEQDVFALFLIMSNLYSFFISGEAPLFIILIALGILILILDYNKLRTLINKIR